MGNNDDKKAAPTPPDAPKKDEAKKEEAKKEEPKKAEPPKPAPPPAKPCPKKQRNPIVDAAMENLGKALVGGVEGFAKGAATPFAPPPAAPPPKPPMQVGKLTLPHPTDQSAKDTLDEVERQIDKVIAEAVRGALDGAVRGVAKNLPPPAPPPKKPPLVHPFARICLMLSISAAVGVLFLAGVGANIPYVEQLAVVLLGIGGTVTFVVNLIETAIRNK